MVELNARAVVERAGVQADRDPMGRPDATAWTRENVPAVHGAPVGACQRDRDALAGRGSLDLGAVDLHRADAVLGASGLHAYSLAG